MEIGSGVASGPLSGFIPAGVAKSLMSRYAGFGAYEKSPGVYANWRADTLRTTTVLVHNTSDTGGFVQPPQGAKILQTAPNGKWVIFEDFAGGKKIQFDVSEANNLTKGPLGPGRGSPETGAFVGPNGKVTVVEGMHRLEAAKGGAQIAVGKGGIPGLAGWLEFDLWPPN
jgi:hypothetical protein